MKIAITGHRPNKLGNDYNLTSPLINDIKIRLQELIDWHKPTHLISGMALGIDTLWAKMAIKNNIKLIAAIPCLNQDKMWVKPSKDLYKEILSNPLTETIYISDKEYTFNCMNERNIWMVDNCDFLISVWDGTSGGTKNCVDYAISKKKDIIRIDPKNMQENNKYLVFE